MPTGNHSLVASLQRSVQQAERVADVTVPGRLRRAGRRAAEPVRGMIVVNQRAAAVRVVVPWVAPVEGAAADDQRKRQREPTCKPTTTRRTQPHLFIFFHSKRQA